jgi:hypothetical protein
MITGAGSGTVGFALPAELRAVGILELLEALPAAAAPKFARHTS